MSHGDESARDVLRRMGQLNVPTDIASDPSRQYRVAATIDAHLEQLSREKSQKRRQLRTIGVLAIAAAVPLLWLGARRLSAPGASAPASAQVMVKALQGSVAVTREGQVTDAGKAPLPLVVADEVQTGAGSRAQTQLKSGALATLEQSSSLVLGGPNAQGEELGLRRGQVEFSVPHLPPGGSFAVRTPDALVTVHGTRFSVAVSEVNAHSVTRVAVTEGTVWVEHAAHTIVLTAGGSWSSDAAPLVPPAPAATQIQPSSQPAAAIPVTGASAAAVAVAARPSGVSDAGEHKSDPLENSTLAEENRAYLRAMASAKAGNDRQAVTEFETLLAQHPSSPLAQSAEAERFRALSRLGRAGDAARAARHYLVVYPRGFAAAEARMLSGTAP